jgi:hypothetical protein
LQKKNKKNNNKTFNSILEEKNENESEYLNNSDYKKVYSSKNIKSKSDILTP